MSDETPPDQNESNTGTGSDRNLRETADRLLTIVLLFLLVISLLGVVYVAVDPPRATDPYTEFYLLGPEGNASDYPTRLAPGETGTVIVGLTNHEGQPTDYRVRVVDTNASGDGTLETASRTVSPKETWEMNVTFSIDERSLHRVQFQLYKEAGTGEPYLTNHLWVNVTIVEHAKPPASPNGTEPASSNGTATGTASGGG